MKRTGLSSSLLAMGEPLILLCYILIENLILIYLLCYVCRSWVDYSFEGDERQRLVNQVLGNLIRLHHMGVVTLPVNGHRELATTLEHYRFAPDGSYGNAQRTVAHNFWVSIFSMHDFFLYYSSVLMCFLLHILFCSYVFNHTVHKVVKDAISYARIQANNVYYREVLGQKMNKKLGSSTIYLTEEQYKQVKVSKSFYIQYLILIFT
jgi:hypothetical protein